jgi:hypothetical protein
MSLTRNLAIASALALGAAPAVAIAGPTHAVTQTVKAEKTQAPVSSDSKSYADREAQDKQVGEYEGGNTVVIGISGGALVVLLLLLLII